MIGRRAIDGNLRRASAGLALLALAAFGLVAAPLLHAELHAREAETDREMSRLVERLALHGADFDEVFAQVWRLSRGRRAPPHSHGPAQDPRERHGNGTLEHFALALHAAPPPPTAPSPLPQPQVRHSEVPARVFAQPRRMPALSQGPPLW